MSLRQRFDSDQTQRILSRAAELQQTHQETLSAEQLEALAAEIGLAPEFVRLALQEQETAALARATAPTLRRTADRRAVITRRDVVLTALGATVPAVVLGLLIPGRSATPTPFLAVFGMALLATLGLGFRHPSRRLGAFGGAVFAVTLLATALANLGGGGANVPAGLLVLAGLGALLGAAGAAGRRIWNGLPSERATAIERIVEE